MNIEMWESGDEADRTFGNVRPLRLDGRSVETGVKESRLLSRGIIYSLIKYYPLDRRGFG